MFGTLCRISSKKGRQHSVAVGTLKSSCVCGYADCHVLHFRRACTASGSRPSSVTGLICLTCQDETAVARSCVERELFLGRLGLSTEHPAACRALRRYCEYVLLCRHGRSRACVLPRPFGWLPRTALTLHGESKLLDFAALRCFTALVQLMLHRTTFDLQGFRQKSALL